MPPKPVIKGAATAANSAGTTAGATATAAAAAAKGKSSTASTTAAASTPDSLVLDADTPSAPSAPPALPDFDLSTCSAQEYLSRTIYPTLAPLLTSLDAIRPANPVEYLALAMAREAATTRERVQQLDEIHELREGLRAQYKREYNVEGRV